MGTGELNAGGNPEMDWQPIQRGVEIPPVATYYSNRGKLKLILIHQRKNSEKMLQNVMSYISTLRKQTMPLWDSSRYSDKIFSKS